MKKTLLSLSLFALVACATPQPEQSKGDQAGDKVLAMSFARLSELMLKNCPNRYKIIAGMEAEYKESLANYYKLMETYKDRALLKANSSKKTDCEVADKNINLTHYLELK